MDSLSPEPDNLKVSSADDGSLRTSIWNRSAVSPEEKVNFQSSASPLGSLADLPTGSPESENLNAPLTSTLSAVEDKSQSSVLPPNSPTSFIEVSTSDSDIETASFQSRTDHLNGAPKRESPKEDKSALDPQGPAPSGSLTNPEIQYPQKAASSPPSEDKDYNPTSSPSNESNFYSNQIRNVSNKIQALISAEKSRLVKSNSGNKSDRSRVLEKLRADVQTAREVANRDKNPSSMTIGTYKQTEPTKLTRHYYLKMKIKALFRRLKNIID